MLVERGGRSKLRQSRIRGKMRNNASAVSAEGGVHLDMKGTLVAERGDLFLTVFSEADCSAKACVAFRWLICPSRQMGGSDRKHLAGTQPPDESASDD